MGEQHITEHQSIEKAFYSSYRILTNKISFEELLDEDDNKGSPTLLAHDPEKNITVGVIQDLIDYFVDLEEYELCAELKAEMDKKFSS
jgi:hypothetical protein